MTQRYWQLWDVYFAKQITYGAYIVFAIIIFFIFSFFVSLFYKYVLRKYGEEKADKVRNVFGVIWLFMFFMSVCFTFMLLVGNRIMWITDN